MQMLPPALTRQLLAFSRKQILDEHIIDLNRIIENTKKLLNRLIGETIAMKTNLPEDLGSIKADPGQIEQIIINLALNARDAMPKGGRIQIDTRNEKFDYDYINEQITVKRGNYIWLSVSDTGCGISKEMQKHIFEPFFTTKEKGKGTGLGLSMVYGIVKQSKGYIWVYSEPDKGTTFKILFPRVYAQPEEVISENKPVQLFRGSETILIVEDDDNLRKMTSFALNRLGYQVLEASNTRDALKYFISNTKPIDLVISDMSWEKKLNHNIRILRCFMYPVIRIPPSYRRGHLIKISISCRNRSQQKNCRK